ncbi:lipopolysaccharide kinase InaA family protein, partial [Bacillus cereus group sp. Bc256]|uniref:lipopolysaccharide kinase InaA family protein n=1 Tax=Bacillus cereus group sp. Bc256 TaxID=3018102 RepID=UPI003F69C949
MALRHYYRGGLFGKLVKDQYWFTGWETTRCGAELTLLAYLRAKKLPVPRPVAARAVKSGRTYRADILVEKVRGARDLVAILCEHALLAHDY